MILKGRRETLHFFCAIFFLELPLWQIHYFSCVINLQGNVIQQSTTMTSFKDNPRVVESYEFLEIAFDFFLIFPGCCIMQWCSNIKWRLRDTYINTNKWIPVSVGHSLLLGSNLTFRC